MIRVSSNEFGKDVRRYRYAVSSQPPIVARNRRDWEVFSTADMPEDLVEAVRKSEMGPRHNHLNELLKDWTP